MINLVTRRQGRLLLGLGAGVISLFAGNTAFAETAPTLTDPQPFEAHYRLELRGWPNANITHRLSNEGSHWLIDMRFSIAVAQGQESSRFMLDQDNVQALLYSSRYSLFGMGDRYQLRESDIPTLDRQTALFDLSRRAGQEHCTLSAPCALEFVDHKGRDEQYHYYADKQPMTLPDSFGPLAGDVEAVNVSLVNNDKPDRLLQLSFHPDWPGLILSAAYQKEGSQETQLTLTNFNSIGGATP